MEFVFSFYEAGMPTTKTNGDYDFIIHRSISSTESFIFVTLKGV